MMFRSRVEVWSVGRRFALLALVVTLAALAGLAFPTTAVAANEAAQVEGPVPAMVRYYNRDILSFRAAFMGRSPLQRAEVAEFNIKRIVDEPGLPGISFKDTLDGTILLLGGEVVTMITPQDVDSAHGQSMAQVRDEVQRQLGDAVAAAERERAPGRVLRGVMHSLAATLLAVALIWLIAWGARRLRAAMLAWVGEKAGTLRSAPLRQMLTGANAVADWLSRAVLLVAVLVLAEEWLRYIFRQFDYTQPWATAMTLWLAGQAKLWLLAAVAAIPGLVTAVIIFLLARLCSQIVGMLFRGVQNGRFKLFGIDRQLAEPTRKLTVGGIWLFALAMAYPYLPGSSSDAFKGLSVLLGVMISLGGSSVVGQAAAGFTLLYARTMSVGDLVNVADVEGQVVHIGLFTTRIRTITGVEASIPNMHVLSGKLLNYSRDPQAAGMWLETSVTIGYDTPWRQVHRLLLDAAGKTAHVQSTPAAHVLQTALNDFYVAYVLRVHIVQLPLRAQIRSELHANIQDAFNAAGVQIMSPNYIADPELPKIVPPADWDPKGPTP
ncbi:mechanosensitive ion channel family protein [Stenotrophomonas terrae]|uniref:mechanosensitive ion channel family protein n=1 Tax=Stenotrophomonas terrae TaxID=405446 RepID=UPI00320836CB